MLLFGQRQVYFSMPLRHMCLILCDIDACGYRAAAGAVLPAWGRRVREMPPRPSSVALSHLLSVLRTAVAPHVPRRAREGVCAAHAMGKQTIAFDNALCRLRLMLKIADLHNFEWLRETVDMFIASVREH